METWMTSPLDEPLRASLSTLHRSLAMGDERVLRYPRDVAPFLAVASADVSEVAQTLIAPGEEVFTLGPAPAPSASLIVRPLAAIVQMVQDTSVPEPDGAVVVPLGPEHEARILALAAAVYPHYFRARTTRLGPYFGIFEGETLAAMAGHRMGMPGFREISAVCTAPGSVGRGHARRLLAVLGNAILARGEVPFLHVSPDNARARELYARNGWRQRAALAFTSIRRTP
jgi:ribosomal protein S18 acetylase RimI-like enzyme